MKKICLSIIFLCSILCEAQNKRDTENILLEYENYKNTNLVKANKYASKAVNISKQFNDSVSLLKSYYHLAESLFKIRKIDEAERTIDSSLAISKVKNYKAILSLNYLLKSNIQRKKGNYKESFTYLNKALKIAEQEKDLNLISRLKISQSILFKRTKNGKKANELLFSLLKEKENMNDAILTSLYNSVGISFLIKNKDSSIFYYKKALELSEKTRNITLGRKIAGNLGKAFMLKKDFKNGLHYLKLSEKKAHEISDFAGLHYINISLALYYEQQENYKEAIKKYLIAINDYGKYVDDSQKAHLYWLLSGALWHDKQFEKGFEYQEKYIELQESLFTIDKNRTFEKLQTEYDVEKKNNQIQFLEKEQKLEAQQKKLIFGIGGLILIALILLVFMYRYRMKSQKTIRTQEQELFIKEKEKLEQKQKIKRIESYIEGEEKEKNRIAIELHDGIGGQLSGIKHFVSSLDSSTGSNELLKNITSVTKEVRLLSHSLSSNYSIQQPFNSLLTTLQERYKNHFDIEINIFPQNEIQTITVTQKVFLFRSIQELINNIYKYAKANIVTISITLTDEITLIIEDNGIGFNTTETPSGIGLQNIADRVKTLHGEFVVDSVLEKGTSILIKIPKKHD